MEKSACVTHKLNISVPGHVVTSFEGVSDVECQSHHPHPLVIHAFPGGISLYVLPANLDVRASLLACSHPSPVYAP
jgi:hypothetical protein